MMLYKYFTDINAMQETFFKTRYFILKTGSGRGCMRGAQGEKLLVKRGPILQAFYACTRSLEALSRKQCVVELVFSRYINARNTILYEGGSLNG